MPIKLYTCSHMWFNINAHPCAKVRKALDEQGIEYELVEGPQRKSKRDELDRVSNQRTYPTIQFEDGSAYREESKDMAARIRDGKLFEKGGTGGGPQPDAG